MDVPQKVRITGFVVEIELPARRPKHGFAAVPADCTVEYTRPDGTRAVEAFRADGYVQGRRLRLVWSERLVARGLAEGSRPEVPGGVRGADPVPDVPRLMDGQGSGSEGSSEPGGVPEDGLPESERPAAPIVEFRRGHPVK